MGEIRSRLHCVVGGRTWTLRAGFLASNADLNRLNTFSGKEETIVNRPLSSAASTVDVHKNTSRAITAAAGPVYLLSCLWLCTFIGF